MPEPKKRRQPSLSNLEKLPLRRVERRVLELHRARKLPIDQVAEALHLTPPRTLELYESIVSRYRMIQADNARLARYERYVRRKQSRDADKWWNKPPAATGERNEPMALAETPVTPAPAVMQVMWDPWLNKKFATLVLSQMPQRSQRENVVYSPYDGRPVAISDNTEQPIITTVVAPSAPTTLTAAAEAGAVSLTWSEGEGAQGYAIYRGTATGEEGESPYACSAGTATTFTDTTVAAGTTYFYTVESFNPAGNSGASPEASAAPNAFAAAPSAPAAPSATAGSGKITIAWTAAAGATSYSIFSGSTSSGEGATPHASTAGASFVDFVTTGTEVYYTVKALNATGISIASSEVSATAA